MLILTIAVSMIDIYSLLLVSRFAKGIYFGISTCCLHTFIIEISPMKNRGSLLALPNLFLVSGLTSSQIISFLLPDFKQNNSCDELDGHYVIWREYLAVPVLFALLQFLLLLWVFKTENPKFLNITLEEERSSMIMYFNSIDLQNEDSLNPYSSESDKSFILEKNSIDDEDTFAKLASPSGLRALIAGWMVTAFQELSGITLVLAYAYYYGRNSSDIRLNLRQIMSLAIVVSHIFSIYLCKICNRKPMLLVSFLITWACNWWLFQVFDYGDVDRDDDITNTVVIAITYLAIGVFIICFGVALGPVAWVYTTEILTEKGMSISTFIHWVIYAIVFYLPNVGISITEGDDKENIDLKKSIGLFFFFFSGASLWGFFLVLVFIRESKGLDYKCIQNSFSHKYSVHLDDE